MAQTINSRSSNTNTRSDLTATTGIFFYSQNTLLPTQPSYTLSSLSPAVSSVSATGTPVAIPFADRLLPARSGEPLWFPQRIPLVRRQRQPCIHSSLTLPEHPISKRRPAKSNYGEFAIIKNTKTHFIPQKRYRQSFRSCARTPCRSGSEDARGSTSENTYHSSAHD